MEPEGINHPAHIYINTFLVKDALRVQGIHGSEFKSNDCQMLRRRRSQPTIAVPMPASNTAPGAGITDESGTETVAKTEFSTEESGPPFA